MTDIPQDLGDEHEEDPLRALVRQLFNDRTPMDDTLEKFNAASREHFDHMNARRTNKEN